MSLPEEAMTPRDQRKSQEWQDVQEKEYIKLLVADTRRLIDDMMTLAVNYNPLDPEAAMDDVYQLAKQGEENLNTIYRIFLEEWAEAVKRARQGKEFEGEEARDIQTLRNIIKTKEMGRSTRRRTKTGNWQEHWKRTAR
jgi:hypothetical protein